MEPPINFFSIQFFSITGSILFLTAIIELIRRKKLKEEYSLLWLFFGIVFLFVSIFRKVIDFISFVVGIAYPPAALFLIMIIALIVILIHFSVVISRLTDYSKNLVQELGLLKHEIDKLKQVKDCNKKERK